jgi:hypothetical protein
LDFFTKNNKTKKEVLLMIETNVGLVFMMRLKSEISGSFPSRLMVMLASSYMSRKDNAIGFHCHENLEDVSWRQTDMDSDVSAEYYILLTLLYSLVLIFVQL